MPGELFLVGLFVLDFILMICGGYIIDYFNCPLVIVLDGGYDSSVLLILCMYWPMGGGLVCYCIIPPEGCFPLCICCFSVL